MEYDEVLYKLIDKVLVLDLKIQKNERSNLISSGKKHQKTNELCLISVGMNTNTNTKMNVALLDFCPWHKYKYKYKYNYKYKFHFSQR